MADAIRTTLALEKDVYAIIKNVAEARRISLGKAVGELVRKAVNEKPVYKADFPVFQVTESAKSFGLNEVLAAEDAEI